MTNPNPITPPPELVQQWIRERDGLEHLAAQAARWGADQELEACVEWLQDPDLNVDTYKLRAARRPKPQPSLKELALKALEHLSGWDGDADTIRRALELVPEGPAVTPAAEPAAAPDRPEAGE